MTGLLLFYCTYVFLLTYCQTERRIPPSLTINTQNTYESLYFECKLDLRFSQTIPDFMFFETYNNSALYVKVRFRTDKLTEEACKNSKQIEISSSFSTNTIVQKVMNKNRYKGNCSYKNKSLPMAQQPIRMILMNIKPFMEFDLTWWRCVAEFDSQQVYKSSLSQGNLADVYGTYYKNITKRQTSFNLSLQVDKQRKIPFVKTGYLPLSCILQNKSQYHSPNIQQFPHQPWKSLQFVMRDKKNTRSTIETDMYGRRPDHLKIIWDTFSGNDFAPNCASTSQFETVCFNRAHMNAPLNKLLDTTQCFNFTLFAAPNSVNSYSNPSQAIFIRTLFDFGDNFTRQLVMDIEDKIAIELPSKSNYHCFPIVEAAAHETTLFLCPHAPLIVDLYREVITAMKEYSRMEVKYIDEKNNITLSCAEKNSKLIYISSDYCVSTNLCGSVKGKYKTKVLQNGEMKQINTTQMACFWKTYFCFSRKRLTLIDLTLMINYMAQSNASYSNGFYINPWECPFKNKKGKMNVAIGNITQSAQKELNTLFKEDTDLLNFQTNTTTLMLNQSCPCRTIPTVCPSDTIQDNLFSTNLLFPQKDAGDDPDIWCEAFSHLSPKRKLSQLFIDYVCQNDIPSEVVKKAAPFLPQPIISAYPHEGNNVIIECKGLPVVCLNSTSSPTVTFSFWSSQTLMSLTHNNTNKSGKETKMCISSNPCHQISENTTSVFVLSSNKMDTQISIDRNILLQHEYMLCSYLLGEKISPIYRIAVKINESMEICKKDDYKIEIIRPNEDIIACIAHYSHMGGKCTVPTISLNVPHKSISCSAQDYGKKETCSYYSERMTGWIKEMNNMPKNVNVTCTLKGIVEKSKMGEIEEVEMNKTVKIGSIIQHCIDAPTFFKPSIVIKHENDAFKIECGYASLPSNTCAQKAFNNISLVLEESRPYVGPRQIVIAKRTHLQKCSNVNETHCTVENPPNKTLLSVTVPHSFEKFKKVNHYFQVFCSHHLNDHIITNSTKYNLSSILKKWKKEPMYSDYNIYTVRNQKVIKEPHDFSFLVKVIVATIVFIFVVIVFIIICCIIPWRRKCYHKKVEKYEQSVYYSKYDGDDDNAIHYVRM